MPKICSKPQRAGRRGIAQAFADCHVEGAHVIEGLCVDAKTGQQFVLFYSVVLLERVQDDQKSTKSLV